MQRSVAEIFANIRLLGRAAGVSDRGEQLARSLEDRLASTMQRVKGRTLPRAVMITGRLGNGLLLVARPGTYTGDAIELAGGRFALEGRGVIAQVSPEAIMSADPDVLLYAGSPADRDELIKRPGWSEMRAVTKRAYAVSRVELLIPGPRTIDGIEHLAALLHPAASEQ
jgi:iron complex transport system substrate-binding protein